MSTYSRCRSETGISPVAFGRTQASHRRPEILSAPSYSICEHRGSPTGSSRDPQRSVAIAEVGEGCGHVSLERNAMGMNHGRLGLLASTGPNRPGWTRRERHATSGALPSGVADRRHFDGKAQGFLSLSVEDVCTELCTVKAQSNDARTNHGYPRKAPPPDRTIRFDINVNCVINHINRQRAYERPTT